MVPHDSRVHQADVVSLNMGVRPARARDDIVVTGIGIVGPLGATREAFWSSLVAGRRGLLPASGPWSQAFSASPIGLVPDAFLEALDEIDCDGFVIRSRAMLLAAIREAEAHSGAMRSTVDTQRVGVFVGTCAGPMLRRPLAAGSEIEGLDRARGRRTLESLARDAAAAVSASGPRLVVNTACAGGAHAIGVAAHYIRAGDIDVAFAGGVDELNPMSALGFAGVGALDSDYCSPYGRSGGLNLGEGCAFLVLEDGYSARERGAKTIASLLGSGFSADAFHPTASDPAGFGAELAVRRALAVAGVQPAEIDYVDGHGTATPANDAMELALLARLFEDAAHRPPVSATKAATGHALAGSAAMEAAVCALAVERDVTPPVALAGVGHDRGSVEVALSTSYAFGGNNACVVFGRTVRRHPSPDPVDVLISGIGAVGAPGIGLGSWFDAIRAGVTTLTPETVVLESGHSRSVMLSRAPELERVDLASRRDWRRLDTMARQCVIAARLALEDAGADDLLRNDDVAVVVGTQSGPFDTAMRLHNGSQRIPPRIDPTLFANAPLSSTAGHICTTFGWRGPTVTIASGWVSALDALIHGSHLIRAQEVPAALVVASDVLTDHVVHDLHELGMLADDAVRPFDRSASGTGTGSAAVAVLLERPDAITARARSPYARVVAGASLGADVPYDQLPTSAGHWSRCISRVLAAASLAPSECDLVVAAASGVDVVDAGEASALAELFPHRPYVTAPKGAVGECRGADGLVGVVNAAYAFESGVTPPTPGLVDPRSGESLRFGPSDPASVSIRNCLVNAASPGGTYASVALQALTA